MKGGCLLRLVVVVAVLIVVVYLARRPIVAAIGGFLIVSEEPRAANAIVVLSGSIPDRILEAVDLYREGFATRIILTREQPLPGLAVLHQRGVILPEHHDQNRSIAEQLGVPSTAISIIADRASSTFAEAQFLIADLRAQHIRRVLLVTSKAHARRANWIFDTLAKGDPEFIICPSRHDPFSPDTWWQSRGLVRRVVIEYGKLATFLLVDRWRAP
jgi:uncharacterized SAM-binding protein YcdF (DUF218 family)